MAILSGEPFTHAQALEVGNTAKYQQPQVSREPLRYTAISDNRLRSEWAARFRRLTFQRRRFYINQRPSIMKLAAFTFIGATKSECSVALRV